MEESDKTPGLVFIYHQHNDEIKSLATQIQDKLFDSDIKSAALFLPPDKEELGYTNVRDLHSLGVGNSDEAQKMCRRGFGNDHCYYTDIFIQNNEDNELTVYLFIYYEGYDLLWAYKNDIEHRADLPF